jgi:hypothetical protein
VLRRYCPDFAISPQAYASRVFSIRGRKELRSNTEQVIFEENPRDPEVTVMLRAACVILNTRGFERNCRNVQYCVETASDQPRRQPPAGPCPVILPGG